MSKIILKTDSSPANLETIAEDISLLRDILATLVREHHTKGRDRYDNIEDSVERISKEVLGARNEVELVKNEGARFDKKLKEFKKDLDETRLKINRTMTKVNRFVADYDEKADRIDTNYKGILKAFDGDLQEGSHNIATLAIRLANLIKDVDKLKKKKFLGIF